MLAFGRTLIFVVEYTWVGQLESTSQTASRSAQPFLHGSRLWKTDRPRAIGYSVCNNRPHICICSTAMRPNGKTTE